MSFELPTLDLSPIRAPLWAYNGHLQTLAGFFIPSPETPGFGEMHEVELDDGDRLEIFITRGIKPYVVTQFHGLTGDMTTPYMRRGASLARRMGFSHVFVNHRGAQCCFLKKK